MVARRIVPVVIICLTCACLTGCKPQEENETPESPNTPTEASFVMTDAVLAKLTSADAADGTPDQVITKCVMCKLGMDGKADHTATVEDYKVQLCSPACQEHFEKDPAEALLALSDQ